MVKLAPEIEEYVNAKVKHGVAGSADEYVNRILRAQREQERRTENELWTRLQVGMDDIDAGRHLPLEEAFEEIRTRLGIRAGEK